ncbi:hypothetical protein Patl1_21687 [Pistacia atlantica]|uniref:Uncharacterized protein n=1 Tax=Pistacia atlantica TaxID=434234 RepID=A0ACC1BL82_9ROSI|nr:hypothetical protein Patl1_21687 [Pistacia atlantica]
MAKYLMGCLCSVILVMILSNANQSRASSLPKSNSTSTTFQDCNGSVQDCLIADEENVEFLFDSEIVTPSIDIGASSQAFRPVVDCGRGKSYTPCVPDPQNSKILERCYDKLYVTRNRGCASG